MIINHRLRHISLTINNMFYNYPTYLIGRLVKRFFMRMYGLRRLNIIRFKRRPTLKNVRFPWRTIGRQRPP
jgi:hypothetical protein